MTMDYETEKCVLILDADMPAGLLANTAAILGITLGRQLPEAVGGDVTDGSGQTHLGITAFPVPVLRGTAESLQSLRQRLGQPEFRDLTVADFSQLAQSCRTYGEFQEKMARTAGEDLRYLGLAICGDKRKVSRLTGSLPLLR